VGILGGKPLQAAGERYRGGGGGRRRVWGTVTRIRDSRNSDQYQCFTYDTMDRLTDAYTADDCVDGPDSTGDGAYDHYGNADDYDYNQIGNITDLNGTAYTYPTAGNPHPHAPDQVGSVVFAYDPNGNRYTATDGTDVTTYSYGADNRLEDITVPGGDILEYWYDADGQRVRRRHKGTPNYNTYYAGGLVEVDTEGSTLTETRTMYSFGGLPVAVRTHVADETTFVFTDHLGSVTSTWNDTTDTLTLTRYFPYGGERHSSGVMPQDQRYTGQVSDATANGSAGSGLLYYGARYYDPVTAQFAQPDSIVPSVAASPDFNRYSYVRGNPVRYLDSGGHDPDESYLKPPPGRGIGGRASVADLERLQADFNDLTVSIDAVADLIRSVEAKTNNPPLVLYETLNLLLVARNEIGKQIVIHAPEEWRPDLEDLTTPTVRTDTTIGHAATNFVTENSWWVAGSLFVLSATGCGMPCFRAGMVVSGMGTTATAIEWGTACVQGRAAACYLGLLHVGGDFAVGGLLKASAAQGNDPGRIFIAVMGELFGFDIDLLSDRLSDWQPFEKELDVLRDVVNE